MMHLMIRAPVAMSASFARRLPWRAMGAAMLRSATALSRVASPYRPPMPLEDLHILDDLERAGSQARTGAALAMHHSTVSRHGHNPCLQHLRLAARENG
jgi:hypothetical protein